ncbi:hypothetical protein KAI11_03715 [Candidatus Bathyarchaeota archaeon]|nr:hypothetical protein [Candidatus Bathyarchaeota archaeon]
MGLNERPQVAFILSLIGGILILLGGGVSSMWFMLGGLGMGGMMGGFGGMMGGFQGMMGSLGVPLGFISGFFLIGLVSGVLVTIGAVMLNAHPSEHMAWGIIILVFSVISLLGMGGFVVGAILGIVGGTLSLSWKPT